ncbi:hypothetical protein E4U41_001294 [Claviceps citrina]|nr:hypothetical protein E4U41_001294 [Claviceps citrina]
MLSIVRSNLTFIAQIIFVTLHALALVFASAYNSQAPDLYPNNSHHKIGWIITFVVLAQFLIHFTEWLAGVSMGRNGRQRRYAHRLMPDPDTAHLQLLSSRDRNEETCQLADGSGCGSDPETETSRSNSISAPGAASLPSITRATLATKAAYVVSFRGWKYLGISSRIIDWLILPFGFIAITTGEGQALYSGLAHWIKGGVFFWLGLITLGRWSGSFAELGWAWNVRPVVYRQLSWCPSAEFVESSLIFIYGATNIFLEHLGSWGQEWSHQDLEHLSITVLFIGGGLSALPSRPPTELLVSFGLLAGGIIFMASSSDTIDAMIHHKLDAMFLYTVTIGLVQLLMAWEMIVLAIKGWATRREMRMLRMECA